MGEKFVWMSANKEIKFEPNLFPALLNIIVLDCWNRTTDVIQKQELVYWQSQLKKNITEMLACR